MFNPEKNIYPFGLKRNFILHTKSTLRLKIKVSKFLTSRLPEDNFLCSQNPVSRSTHLCFFIKKHPDAEARVMNFYSQQIIT